MMNSPVKSMLRWNQKQRKICFSAMHCHLCGGSNCLKCENKKSHYMHVFDLFILNLLRNLLSFVSRPEGSKFLTKYFFGLKYNIQLKYWSYNNLLITLNWTHSVGGTCFMSMFTSVLSTIKELRRMGTMLLRYVFQILKLNKYAKYMTS